MVKLENVSVDQVLSRNCNEAIFDLVESQGIKTVQELIDELAKRPNIKCGEIWTNISRVQNDVERVSFRGKDPVVFETKKYEDSSLSYNDSLNKGNILLITRPTVEYGVRYLNLKDLTVGKIKDYLSLTTSTGKNYLASEIYKVGLTSVPAIVEAVDMYTDQIVRQSKLTDKRDKNLFTLEQAEKMEIVESLYAEIIAYLIYDTEEFVWGEISDYQKKLLLSSIINDKSRRLEHLVKERMIEIVSNYTTLPELSEVQKGDYSVLSRFIKR